MANKKCNYCQTEIDLKAKICPNCKKDLRNWFVRHPIITGFLVITLIGMVGSAGTSTTSENKNSFESGFPDKSETVSEEKNVNPEKEAEKVKTVKVGEEVIVGDVKWKVLKAWIPTQLTNYSGPVKTSGKFLVINVVVENLGKELKSVTDLKVVDDQNREFISYSGSFGLNGLGAEPLYLLSNLNPNVPYTFADVYEIPADAKGLTLRLGDLEFLGSDEGIVDLGL